MATKVANRPVSKNTALTKTSAVSTSAAPSYLKKKGGVGKSKEAADNMVPLIYLLQPLSPQVMKKNPAFIEGAEAGDIWLKGAPNPIVKGDNGIDFVPCAFWKSWTEWVPRNEGGGLVKVYPNDPETNAPVGLPDDAEKDDNGFNYVRSAKGAEGNIIVANRNYAGYVFEVAPTPLPYVMILSSTGHTFGRQFMTALNMMVDKDTGDDLPIWSKHWKLKTVHKSNNQGEWYMYGEPEAGEWTSEAEADLLERLSKAFATGARVAEAPEAPDTSRGRSEM